MHCWVDFVQYSRTRGAFRVPLPLPRRIEALDGVISLSSRTDLGRGSTRSHLLLHYALDSSVRNTPLGVGGSGSNIG